MEDQEFNVADVVKAYNETETYQYASVEPRLRSLDRIVMRNYPGLNYGEALSIGNAACSAWKSFRRMQKRELESIEKLRVASERREQMRSARFR